MEKELIHNLFLHCNVVVPLEQLNISRATERKFMSLKNLVHKVIKVSIPS